MKRPALLAAAIGAVAISSAMAMTGVPSAPASAAQDGDPKPWQPAPGLTQVPLWPEGVAILPPQSDKPETTVLGSRKVAGDSWTAAMNVAKPTMTIYPPKGRNTGTTMLVFPGGGYEVVAMDLEGSEICDWITRKGVTCVLLKYRVPQSWHPDGPNSHQAPRIQLALQDAQRAMGLLRARSAALGVDPHRIGVIGFSAGGHLVAAVSNAGERTYAPVDAADREPSRPDFAIALYPGHLWSGEGVGLYGWNEISRDAPPTLLIHAMDDRVDDVRNSIAYALALREVGVPVEMHLYAKGGHAFGLRPGPAPILGWPALAETWMRGIDML